MRRQSRIACLLTLLFALAPLLLAQQSDYAIKKNFDTTYKSIFNRVEAANSIGALDSMKSEVDSLELRNLPHADFLDKTLYPETFADRIRSLRTLHSLTYEKVYLIQTQGLKVEELETKIIYLTGKLDTLTTQRDRLLVELEEAKKTNTQYREIIRRLQANLQAKDRLIFALVDSIFLPYGKDSAQISDLHREAISRKLEKANVLTRVEEIAGENAAFLSVTQLQPKDYGSVIDQYLQFNNRWKGLRDKITAAVLAGSKYGTGTVSGPSGKAKPGVPAPPPETPGARVDSLLLLWGSRLQTMIWDGIAKEFTTKGITVDPFHDGASFASSIRNYMNTLKESGQDASTFVNDVWKARIDKEWREALAKPGVLGSAEYAALDREVSQLTRPAIDVKFIVYSLIVILLALAVWWFFVRKPKNIPPAEKKP
jgi:hypothetical protein